MEFHCNSIVSTVPDNPETIPFTISLPVEAIEEIEQGLIPFGLYGKKRATVAAGLIVEALRRPDVQANIEKGRAKAAAKAQLPTQGGPQGRQ
jgi:hypothetical protein